MNKIIDLGFLFTNVCASHIVGYSSFSKIYYKTRSLFERSFVSPVTQDRSKSESGERRQETHIFENILESYRLNVSIHLTFQRIC